MIYFDGQGPATVTLRLSTGRYRAEWLDPTTGAIVRAETMRVDGERAVLTSPAFDEDLALRLVTE